MSLFLAPATVAAARRQALSNDTQGSCRGFVAKAVAYCQGAGRAAPELDSQEPRELVLAFAGARFHSYRPKHAETFGTQIVESCDGYLPKHAARTVLEPRRL
jgi:hypothetical protein